MLRYGDTDTIPTSGQLSLVTRPIGQAFTRRTTFSVPMSTHFGGLTCIQLFFHSP